MGRGVHPAVYPWVGVYTLLYIRGLGEVYPLYTRGLGEVYPYTPVGPGRYIPVYTRGSWEVYPGIHHPGIWEIYTTRVYTPLYTPGYTQHPPAAPHTADHAGLRTTVGCERALGSERENPMGEELTARSGPQECDGRADRLRRVLSSLP